MGNDVGYSLALVEAAAAVMHCEHCRSHAPEGDQPQPGWVGSKYKPSHGVVIVLQNPAVAPDSYGAEREASVQRLLCQFGNKPTVEAYTQLMHFMLTDMAGESGGKPWKMWTHPVRKLVPDRERLAWMNVVKYRTLENNPVTSEAVQHGIKHVQQELEILKPKAVIAIGSDAREALAGLQFPPTVIRRHLKLRGASTARVEQLRSELLDAEVDIG